MNAYKLIPNYTYEDYCQWEGNWEVIDGIAYAMSPMPSPRHQYIATEISVFFKTGLASAKCKCKVYQPVDVVINQNTIVCPDILIVCKPIVKNYLDFPPELVVEIFSPATKQKDQLMKFALYQDFGIQYYVMVDPDTEEVQIYTLVDGKYQLLPESEEFLYISKDCKISREIHRIFEEN